jgi:hypothetical protein
MNDVDDSNNVNDVNGVTDRDGRDDQGAEPIRFDTKIAVLLRDDLAAWQELNVCSFLMSGLAATHPETIGEPYEDADGTLYTAMFRQPVVVLAGGKETLAAAHARALARELRPSVYIWDMFATGNDRDNRAAVRAAGRDQLDLVGLGVYGPRNVVDKIMKGATKHP